MKKLNYLLLAAAIVLAAVPLFFMAGSEFGGTDDKAMEAVDSLHPGYKPWFNAIWEPAPETESLMFALQSAAGAGFIGYFFGYLRGKKAGQSARDGK